MVLGDVRVQLGPDGRQREVHDGGVEADDEQAETADAEDQQPPPARQLCRIFGQLIASGHRSPPDFPPFTVQTGNVSGSVVHQVGEQPKTL
jgi:hypothetical protein